MNEVVDIVEVDLKKYKFIDHDKIYRKHGDIKDHIDNGYIISYMIHPHMYIHVWHGQIVHKYISTLKQLIITLDEFIYVHTSCGQHLQKKNRSIIKQQNRN